jgi:DNA-directed RNA polymerase specialized sigma24 family protein
MLTFLEYFTNREFDESVDPEDAKMRFLCQRNLQDLFLWYSDNLGKKEEFYVNLDKNIRDCFRISLFPYQRRMVNKEMIDEEEIINRTLMRVHDTVEEKIRNRKLNYNTVSGLITTMIRRAVIDIIRRNTRDKRKGVLGFSTVGTVHEPRSLAGDPSFDFEKIGLEDLLRVPGLNPRQKIILTRRSEGVKNQDIAKELYINPSYTTMLYNDARDKIKKHYGIDSHTFLHGELRKNARNFI